MPQRMPEIEIIARAGALYADPDRRCRGAFAVTATGTPCEPVDKRAVRFDALGAIFAAARVKPSDVPEGKAKTVLRLLSATSQIANRHYRASSLAALCDDGREEEAMDVLRRTWMWSRDNPPQDDED